MSTIFSYIMTFFSGLIVGILGNYYAARLVEKAKHKDLVKERKKKFLQIQHKMPQLIEEMVEDLRNENANGCREFYILPGKKFIFNTSKESYCYYENEHPHLKSNIRILEMNGFVVDITVGRTPNYQFTEEFVDFLKAI